MNEMHHLMAVLGPVLEGHELAYQAARDCIKIYEDYLEDHMVCKAATQMHDRLKKLLDEDVDKNGGK